MPHLGDQLVDHLIAYGVQQVFGCPGGQTLPLYNGIAKRAGEIQHTLTRDERSGVYAADGYARVSGRVGVCDATVGPGATNLVSGLIEAYSSSIPLLAIVADIPRDWEHRRPFGGASQGFPQHDFLQGCVKYLGRVEVPNSLPDMLEACLRIATAGRPGPVIIEIPTDVFSSESTPAAFTPNWQYGRFPRLRPGADPAAIGRAVARLRKSRRPIIVAGGGALYSGAGEAVVALASRLRCPVATTLSGKGTIAETHPLSVGVVGRFGIPAANAVLSEADCTIFIGSKAGQGTTLDYTLPAALAPVIQIDIDDEEIGRNYHDTVGLLADAQLGTTALVDALDAVELVTVWDPIRLQALQREWWEGAITYDHESIPGTVKPQGLVRSMRRLMGDEDVLVTDASLSSGWGAGRWRAMVGGRHYFAPRGLAGLGWGLPAAIGVATAGRHDDALGRTVMLGGDGGWAYSMAEVETAARAGLPIIAIVLNNGALGWIKHTASTRYGDAMVSQDFSEVDYAKSAEALGARTARVSDLGGFEASFESALRDTSNCPWVIEVASCPLESPIQNQVHQLDPVPTGY